MMPLKEFPDSFVLWQIIEAYLLMIPIEIPMVVQEFYEDENHMKEFEEWKKNRDKDKK